MKALIVDDSRAMRAFLSDIMTGRGFEVTEAEDGLAALQALARMEQMPDVALLDVMMPRMSGHDLIRLMRARPEWADIRVVMVTAEPSDRLLKKALEFGADGYILKPVDRDELSDKLGSLGLLV